MISAGKALSSIEQALRGARRDEDRLTRMLASATDEAARLRAQQAEDYRALARLRMDELARDDALGRLDSAERAAVEVLERRKTALAELADRRDDLIAQEEEAGNAREVAADRLEKAMDVIEDQLEETRQMLTNDREWLEETRKVKAAEAQATAAAEKAKVAETDRDEKSEPYDDDPLFAYLWQRGYGTSAYRAGPLVRFFDARVARLVGYDTARPNYAMLNEIPKRLREHAERLEQAAADLAQGLQASERAALEKAGIGALEAEMDAADKARDKADADIEALEDKLARLNERLSGLLDGSKDKAVHSAVEGLAQAIAREDLATLYKEAQKTETPEDEKIVSSLRDIESTLVRRDAEAEEVRKAAVDLARKRAELEQSRDHFHRSGYNQPRGTFADGALIGSILTGVLSGALSSKNLNEALGKGFRVRKPRRGGTSFGGLKFPSGSSSRSRGGGGFRTGGRF
ncbi:MAG: hypothetical protein GY798_09080 [Hyphomicrobiales bacterium]|nr:hypothetical protein [Hyphomicrobiales bacterium]